MKLEGDYLFEASVAEVWSALFDPVILAAVMPGCEKLELVDGHYVGDIKVKVGPIQGKFTGKVDLKDKVEPESYTMIVDGRGAPGFVKATAQVTLAAEGAGTRVHYDTDAQVGGKIASVGQRLLEASARAIVAQSLDGLHTNIKLRAQAYRDAAAKQAAAAPAAPPPEATRAMGDAAAVFLPEVAAAAAQTAGATSEAAAASARSPEAAAEAAEVATGGGAAAAVAAASRGGAASGTAPADAAGSDGALFGEPTVKTASPTYIGEPGADTVRSPRPTAPEADKPAGPVVAFTPVKVKQSAVANAVAKEVASSLFPRSVLVAIIVLQALVILWLLLRH